LSNTTDTFPEETNMAHRKDPPASESTALTTTGVSEEVLDAVARELAALQRKTTLGFAIQVGRMVVDRLYGGSLDDWRNGKGAKDGSLRTLADKLQKLGARGLSATTLQQAVATLDLEERAGVSARPQLNASHVRAVIGLPAEKQELLLGTAEAKDWTAEKTEKEAEKVRHGLATRTGRPPLLPFVRTVNQWQRELADATGTFGGLEKASTLKPEEAARVRATVMAMRDRCEALLAELH
jgi:hypothetical protein